MDLTKRIVAGSAATLLGAASPAHPPQYSSPRDGAANPIALVDSVVLITGQQGAGNESRTAYGAGPTARPGPLDFQAASAPKGSGAHGASQPVAVTAAPRQLPAADTTYRLRNGARFMAPGRWSADIEPGAIILSAPESGSRITIADGGTDTAEAAVAAAWKIHWRDAIPAAEGKQRPPREGWDETILYRYPSPAGEPRDVLALALRKGTSWTVLIHDLSVAVSERRGGQLEVIFNSLLPEGYERETFAGRKANHLDAARITALTELIETARREYNIPGVALGLIQNGEVVFQGGFGVRELGRPDRVDENTLFNIASNGKALTTLMLAKLVEADRFNWNTPVATLWPEFRLGEPEMSRRVQVGHLVCACTGMPRQDLETLFEGERSTAASIMQLLSTARPTSEFGDTYQYSNLMAAAAGFLGGHILYPQDELASAYDRAMQELVFDPLGMSATTADFAVALAGNHAAGHAKDVDGRMMVADQGLNLMGISTRPSGNHWSSVRDMLRYVRMELAGGLLPDGRRYIPRHLLEDRQVPQVTEGLNEYYGMGLKIDRQWGVPVIRHGGTASGYRSDMIWLPDHGVGAVILINSNTGVELRAAFRRRLLELLFDGKPIAAEMITSMAPRSRAASAEDRAALTIPADPHLVAGLASRYHSEELGTLVVRNKGAATLFDFGGWSSEIATMRDSDGLATFVTISPGMMGFQFTVADEPSRRRLIVRDADREYVFLGNP